MTSYNTMMKDLRMIIVNLFFFNREVWNRFLDFESNVGDLSSILKVEKRREQAAGEVCAQTVVQTVG